ncbi:hypothetical protein QUF80_09895 [Desulfococcaceae bacterium HSG8]|nr:hypothetical protein [Desulfococcaceae bacterium HSG8]
MSKQGFSGMRPSFNTGKELIMCTVYSKKGKFIPLGTLQDVDIELPYGEKYSDTIRPGYRFSLNVGSRVIGQGVVEKYS